MSLHDAAIMIQWEPIRPILEANQKFVILSHVRPDADSSNFSGGQLTLQLINNAQSADRIEIRNKGN
ncbi:MAG: hypothetical protein FJ267_07115 [Planctomycetes bacterium]|nr:hypothetical protein [Planctomycetota bacterium]